MPYFGDTSEGISSPSDPVARDIPPSQPAENPGTGLPDREPGIPAAELPSSAETSGGTNAADEPASPVTALHDQVQDFESGGAAGPVIARQNQAPSFDSGGPPRPVPYQTVMPGRQQDDVVFLVRSRVTSYWRGWTLEDFNGRHWSRPDPSGYLIPSNSRDGVWHSQETSVGETRLRYDQTFFIQRDQPGAVFMGYQGLRVTANGDGLDGSGVKRGNSYQVLSGYPKHTPEGLGRDHALGTIARLTWLPPDLKPAVSRLSQSITNGSGSDFERAQRIVGYLSREREFDPRVPIELTGSVDIESFLSDGDPGGAMEFGTATVLLARASGLSSRLALGYRPGFRDPLSGALVVRESDFHAWAEIFLLDHGWVPFDGTPPPDKSLAAGGVSPVGKLFQRGAGGQVSQLVSAAPSRLAETLTQLAKTPVLLGVVPVLVAIMMVVRWTMLRASREPSANRRKPPGYDSLPGQSRRDFLKLYRRLRS